jgi:hypothetical protein
MTFKVSQAMVDVINKNANVVLTEQPQGPGPARMVQTTFPFDPPPAEAAEKDRVIAAAKQVLQQALNDI